MEAFFSLAERTLPLGIRVCAAGWRDRLCNVEYGKREKRGGERERGACDICSKSIVFIRKMYTVCNISLWSEREREKCTALHYIGRVHFWCVCINIDWPPGRVVEDGVCSSAVSESCKLLMSFVYEMYLLYSKKRIDIMCIRN